MVKDAPVHENVITGNGNVGPRRRDRGFRGSAAARGLTRIPGRKRISRGFSATCSAALLPPQSGTLSATISTSTFLSPSSASLPVPAASSSSWASKESRACSHPRQHEKHSYATRSIASPSTSRPNTHRGSTKSRFGSPSWRESFFAAAISPAKALCAPRSSSSSPISTPPWPSPSAGPWKQNQRREHGERETDQSFNRGED